MLDNIIHVCDVYQLPSPALYLLQPDQNFLMKVKVEDLEGLGGQSRAGQRTGL